MRYSRELVPGGSKETSILSRSCRDMAPSVATKLAFLEATIASFSGLKMVELDIVSMSAPCGSVLGRSTEICTFERLSICALTITVERIRQWDFHQQGQWIGLVVS